MNDYNVRLYVRFQGTNQAIHVNALASECLETARRLERGAKASYMLLTMQDGCIWWEWRHQY